MQGDRIPQAWVGRDLILCRTGTETWELVTLREVNLGELDASPDTRGPGSLGGVNRPQQDVIQRESQKEGEWAERATRSGGL